MEGPTLRPQTETKQSFYSMKKFFYSLFVLLFTGISVTSFSQSFTTGNIAVVVATASANNTTGSIMEFDPSTANQAPTNTYVIDGTGANAMRFSGSATSTMYLANSDDGTLLSFMGANNTTTGSNVNTLNPRAVGTLNSSYTFNIATTYTGISGNQTRCATSLDNINWYIADQGGLYTNGAGAPSPAANLRGIKSFGGIVYTGLQSATVTTIQVNTVSAITGGTITGLPGLTNNSSFQDFYLMVHSEQRLVAEVDRFKPWCFHSIKSHIPYIQPSVQQFGQPRRINHQ